MFFEWVMATQHSGEERLIIGEGAYSYMCLHTLKTTISK